MPHEKSPPREGCRNGGVGKRGAALIVVMWVLLIVSLIVSSFAFEMQLEARIISAQRKRFKADQLARAGVELAKTMLAFEEDPLEGDEVVYEDPFLSTAAQLAKGLSTSFSEELGDGTVTVHIGFEEKHLFIKTMSADDWDSLFEQTGVPSVDWDELYGCLVDWQDAGDASQLNGAESDDWFYKEKGYECKNAPVNTVDELLLIKGWTREVLYGSPPEEEDNPMTGIAQHLTAWGDKGKLDPNSASPLVLLSVGLSEERVDDILEARLGPDGEEGTEDDGITQEDFAALGLSGDLFTLEPQYATILSEGFVGDVVSTISSVFKLGGEQPSPLFWLEGEAKIMEDE